MQALDPNSDFPETPMGSKEQQEATRLGSVGGDTESGRKGTGGVDISNAAGMGGV